MSLIRVLQVKHSEARSLIHTETLNFNNIPDVIYHLSNVVVPSLITTIQNVKPIIVASTVKKFLEEVRARQPCNLTFHINGKLNLRYSMLHSLFELDGFELLVTYMSDYETKTFENLSIVTVDKDSLVFCFFLAKVPSGRGFILKYSDLLCNPMIGLIGIPNEVIIEQLPAVTCEQTELEHSFFRLKAKK